MHILVIAATAGEFGGANESPGEIMIGGGHTVRLGIAGIGSVATTYFLTSQIHQQRPGLVIQAGIAGSFAITELGNLLAISEDRFADIGVTEDQSFRSVFDMKLVGEDDPPFYKGSLPNPHQNLVRLAGLPVAGAITVNEVSTDPERIRWYQQKYHPIVESMEGAALHYVCLLEKIPFIQIRSISNLIGERDKSKWLMKDSIRKLNDGWRSLLNKLVAYDETHFRI